MYKSFVYIIYILALMILASSALGYSNEYTTAESGISLHWKNKKIPISISTSLINQPINIKSNTDIIELIKNSFKQWEEAADIEFEFSITDKSSVSPKENSGDGVSIITIAPTSENILMFDEKISDVSAKTRLFYTATGEIKEADIVLNPIFLFSTDGTFGTFDFEATLTHEIGHLLGLAHSQIAGSTMHKHQGKNGVYNLPGFNPRTLSDDDKAKAISLYGKRKGNELCCGEITGRLNLVNNTDKQSFIWVEDSKTGRVISGVLTDKKGNFVLSGLPNDIYTVYARDAKNSVATINLGEADLTRVKSKILVKQIDYESKEFLVNFVGYNGQLSSLSIQIQAGETDIIYVAGKGLDLNNYEIGFNSKNLKVNQESILLHNYGKKLSVLSFEVEVSKVTPDGSYSFFLKNRKGQKEYFIGGLTIEPAR